MDPGISGINEIGWKVEDFDGDWKVKEHFSSFQCVLVIDQNSCLIFL